MGSKFYWVIVYSNRVEQIYGLDHKGMTWDKILDLLGHSSGEEPIAIIRKDLAW